MPEYARVRIGKQETTVSAGYAKRHKLDVIDADATDASGRPLATSRAGGRKRKPRTTVAQAAETKSSAKAAEEPKPEEAS